MWGSNAFWTSRPRSTTLLLLFARPYQSLQQPCQAYAISKRARHLRGPGRPLSHHRPSLDTQIRLEPLSRINTCQQPKLHLCPDSGSGKIRLRYCSLDLLFDSESVCQAWLCLGMEGLTTDSLFRDVFLVKADHQLFVTFTSSVFSFSSMGPLKHVWESGPWDDVDTWVSWDWGTWAMKFLTSGFN